MIPIAQLEKELQEINPGVRIVENPNRPGLANVMLNGMDICIGLPVGGLMEEHSPDYVYRMPNDMLLPFKTYGEAKEISTKTLEKLKNPEFASEFFDTSYQDTKDDVEYQ